MCGIAGYTGPRVPDQLERMTSALVHRGPDDEGFYEDERVHLGVRRLAIIDLVHGEQPKASADGRYVLIFNGEVYNYRELRDGLEASGQRFVSSSDTEVVLRLFENHGIDCVDRLVGMFAIAVYDTRTGALYLIRDLLGKKPLYYIHDAATRRLVFASEFAALPLEDRSAHVDLRSLVWYFGEKTTPGDASIDDRVRKLPAGHWLRFDRSGEVELRRYWE